MKTLTSFKKLVLGLLIIGGFVCGATLHADIPAAERAALIALYNSTDGDNWDFNIDWKTPPLDADGFAMPGTEGDWFGVWVVADTVVAINLSDDSLSGTVPAQMGDLPNLEYLDLYYNELAGSIPSQLGDLANLEYLDLSYNELTGSIPSTIGNLGALELLYLGDNQLSGSLPSQLGDLGNLLILHFHDNQIDGAIPGELGNMGNLEELVGGDNLLSGRIPTTLGNLDNLEVLHLRYNELTGPIPAQLGTITWLGDLDLGYNQLTGTIPPQLADPNFLIVLNLDSNQLTGSIPSALGNAGNLRLLNLDDNRLEGSIPADLGNLVNLLELDLDGNRLTGSIPPELGNMASLVKMEMDGNQLSGSIPAALENLSNLEELDLDNNLLTGSIPPELGNLANLEDLDIDNNRFTGTIPPELGNLGQLVFMDLSYNRLTGNVPAALGNLGNLQYLYLEHNGLGGIPAEFENLSALRDLFLHRNRLKSIPAELGNLTGLEVLNLSGNLLDGRIFLNFTNLINLDPSYENCSISYNLIESENKTLTDFFDTKFPGWEDSQTIAPQNISAAPTLPNTVRVSWTPIPYTGNNGGYMVYTAEQSGGPWTYFGITSSKGDSYLDVSVLSAGIRHYFTVRSRTDAHIGNVNNLISDYSDEADSLVISPSISGTITDGTDPLEGVTITFSHDGHTETTDTQGYYSYSMPYGTETTVTPSKTGYNDWTPASASPGPLSTHVVQDFTASLNTYTISGTVTADGLPVEDASITFSFDGHVETPAADGTYSYSVPYGTTTTVSAAHSIIDFTPAQYGYVDLSENKSNQDFTGTYHFGVNITAPEDGDTVSGGVIVTVGVTDTTSATANVRNKNSAGKYVSFYIDGEFVKEDILAPYKYRLKTLYLSNGTHTIEARAYEAGTSDAYVSDQITVTVANSTEPPYIALNRDRLNFGNVIDDSQTGTQEFLVANSGGGILNWNSTVTDAWINVTPQSGTMNGKVAVSVDASGLSAGEYIGTITVSDPASANLEASVAILLTVKTGSDETPLVGEVFTPVDGETVSGVVPITGWALDDTEIAQVKIYRSAITADSSAAGHASSSGELIYVGEGQRFIEDARPDIAALYSSYPRHNSSVWSYRLLTYYLPDEGNGTFTLHIIATDTSGNRVNLGSRTVTCDNINAVKPFGAIDTPTPGGDASGQVFPVNGWVLTPQPNTIPVDGSTISVWVDGVPLNGDVAYNVYREDVAGLLPGYNNSQGAMLTFLLDTTLYANGVHTLALSVTDDAGNSAGIGSRFFRVVNVESSDLPASYTAAYAPGSIKTNRASLDGTLSPTPVLVRKGYDASTTPVPLSPDETGTIRMGIKESQRIEISLNMPGQSVANGTVKGTPSSRYHGYLMEGDTAKSLPTGSFLDRKNGVFYWQPGPGFSGTYPLVFFDDCGTFKKVTIVIR